MFSGERERNEEWGWYDAVLCWSCVELRDRLLFLFDLDKGGKQEDEMRGLGSWFMVKSAFIMRATWTWRVFL